MGEGERRGHTLVAVNDAALVTDVSEFSYRELLVPQVRNGAAASPREDIEVARAPFAASACGRLPATSARPPVLQNGTASLVTYKMFICKLLSSVCCFYTMLPLLTASG